MVKAIRVVAFQRTGEQVTTQWEVTVKSWRAAWREVDASGDRDGWEKINEGNGYWRLQIVD